VKSWCPILNQAILLGRPINFIVVSVSISSSIPADEGPAYGPELEGFAYPWPVQHYEFVSQGGSLHIAYMDVKPATPNGRAIILLHGKNYVAATWQTSITVLGEAGYRVIAPDQIGFGKSTKPAHYQYTFQQLAGNTHGLLASLGIGRVTVVGHSTGGMLGVRYALMYPDNVDQLALVDPIGLEDWKAKGVPWQSVDALYQQELQTTADRIREYERTTYYAGTWQPAYEQWVQMLAGLYRGPGRELVAWNAALLSDMIYTQPVLYEFGDLRMPVLPGDRRQGYDCLRQRCSPSRGARVPGQLSEARKRSGEPHPSRPSGRIPRSRTFAADPGARGLP
jgi:pimeloyl-ACP methyl ester carboxylesterase